MFPDVHGVLANTLLPIKLKLFFLPHCMKLLCTVGKNSCMFFLIKNIKTEQTAVINILIMYPQHIV